MNLYKKNTKIVFFIALVLTLLMPVFFPALRLHYFTPFLVILFYKKPFISCLWGSIGCGLILDLLSPQARLGMNAINFTLTTGILYGQRRHFFSDSMTTLPMMTFFFSLISTVFHVLLISIFDKGIPITKDWIKYDLIMMPALDAALAFCIYILPSFFFGQPIRKGKDYFMQEEEG